MYLLLECITALSLHYSDNPDPLSDAREAIPLEYSFLDQELARYVVRDYGALQNLTMKSVCPHLFCPESASCSLAIYVHSWTQLWYVIVRGIDPMNVLVTFQSNDLGLNLYPLACASSQLSVAIGGIVSSTVDTIIGMFFPDSRTDIATQSYFDSLAVGLSVPGRLYVTFPSAAFYVYSEHINFDGGLKGLFNVHAIQDTIDDMSPAFIRGYLYMLSDLLGMVSTTQFVDYADMTNFYNKYVKTKPIIIEFPGNVAAYIVRTTVGGLSLFGSVEASITGNDVIGQYKILGQTPSQFYGVRHMSSLNYSDSAANAFVQYQFDVFASVFGELLGLFIGETLYLGAYELNLPFMKSELHQICFDEDNSVFHTIDKFFLNADAHLETLDTKIQNWLNEPTVIDFINEMDQLTGGFRTAISSIDDFLVKPFEFVAKAFKPLRRVVQWLDDIGPDIGAKIPDIITVIENIANYLEEATVGWFDIGSKVGLSLFTQGGIDLGWETTQKRFNGTRVFQSLLDLAFAPHSDTLTTATYVLLSGTLPPMAPLTGLGFRSDNAIKLMETNCTDLALGRVAVVGSWYSAGDLDEHIQNTWTNDTSTWRLLPPDNNTGLCIHQWEIEMGPTFPLLFTGVQDFEYATVEEQQTNSIIQTISNFTSMIVKGVQMSCSNPINNPSPAPTLGPPNSRRRLLEVRAPGVTDAWIQMIRTIVDNVEYDERSTCDARLFRTAWTGTPPDEATKVCAMKRYVYMLVPDEALTMPVGYYYDDSPFYERLFTYRQDMFNRFQHYVGESSGTWAELWSPRATTPRVSYVRSRDVDDLWNDVLMWEPHTKRSRRRRLLGTPTKDCLHCAVLEDIKEAIDASLQTMHDQYREVVLRLKEPIQSSSGMQEQSRALSRVTHQNGWRYMSVSDITPYRIGHYIHDFTFGDSALDVVRLIRECDMSEAMRVHATTDELDLGIVVGLAFGLALFAVTIRPLLHASPGPSLIVAWVFFLFGMYYIVSTAFLWVAYEIPITCSIPYPVIPLNLADDITNSIARWIPGCMCAYFPLLTIGETPCDAMCSDRHYDYLPCGAVISEFGLMWSIEYPLNYFTTGLFELRPPDAEMTPYDRTEHSCWVFFTLTNFPLVVIFAGVMFTLFASCIVLMAIIITSSVQAHALLRRGPRERGGTPPSTTLVESSPAPMRVKKDQ